MYTTLHRYKVDDRTLVTKFPEDFLEVPSGWRIAEGDADDLRVCATHPWQVRLILRVVFAPEFDVFLFCRSRSTRWCQARTLVFSDGQVAGTLLYFNPKQRGNCSSAVRSIVQYFLCLVLVIRRKTRERQPFQTRSGPWRYTVSSIQRILCHSAAKSCAVVRSVTVSSFTAAVSASSRCR